MEFKFNSEIFKDLVIVELASVLAGPAVGLFFAELGAKVIKIENRKTGGDVTRSWKHPKEHAHSSTSAYYHSVNWHKEVKMMDLSLENEKEEVVALIESADVVISNFRMGSSQKLGMDYESLKKKNPSLLYGSITAYGSNDPRPGFDALLQAETGWMYMNGQTGGPPTKMPVALIDLLAAHQLKEGLLVALIKKLKTGQGSHVTVSLYDAALSALANQASNYLNLDLIPQRKGSLHPNIAPYGEVFSTRDGEAILLAIGNDEQFRGLCEVLDSTQLKDDDFKSNHDRLQNRAALGKILEDAMGRIEAKVLFEKAADLKVPLGKIRNMEQVFSDELSQPLILNQEEEEGESKRVRTVVFKMQE